MSDADLAESLEADLQLFAAEVSMHIDIVRAKLLDAEAHFTLHIPLPVSWRQRLEFQQRWLASERLKIVEAIKDRRGARGGRGRGRRGPRSLP